MNIETKEVIIVGAGPVGLYAGIICAAKNLDVAIIESLEIVGGQLSTLYPDKNIYNIPGFASIKAKDFIANLVDSLKEKQVPIQTNEKVMNIEHINESYYRLTTSKGIVHAKAVILAIGNGAFIPNKIGVAHEEEAYATGHLHYNVLDVEKFKNKKVAILGGGDSAVDISLMLKDVAESVHLIHRRKEFRAHESSVDALDTKGVEVHTPFEVKDLNVEEGVKELDLDLVAKKTGDELKISADHIVVQYGFKPSVGEIKDSFLPFTKRHKLITDGNMRMEFPGLFAIGDISDGCHAIGNLATGFGEASIAANNVSVYLKHKASLY